MVVAANKSDLGHGDAATKVSLNKLEIFEDALFESGKTSTHRTGITCTLINLNTENGERKKLNWAIFEQLPIYHIHP